MKTNLKFLLSVSLIVAGCTGLTPLSIERRDCLNDNLRFDGVYYNETTLKYIFFYQNGAFIRAAQSQGYFDHLKSYYSDYNNYKNIYILPYFWGVFKINDSSIIAEKWRSSDAFAPYATIRFSGKILNDTTIVFYNSGNSNTNDTFHFYKFFPKPDSTNKFIK